LRGEAILATIGVSPHKDPAIRRDMLALVRQAFEGRYEVEREIGKGGNARIFLARPPGGEPVALKILHPELLVSVCSTPASGTGWSTTS
jgi:hypothetical protein